MAKRVCYSQKLLVIGLFRLAFEWTDEDVQGNLAEPGRAKIRTISSDVIVKALFCIFGFR